MSPWRFIAVPVFVSLLVAGIAPAQEIDVYHALVKSSRVIVLPFLNLSSWPGVRDEIMLEVRAELAGQGVELADPVQTAEFLRRSRLRNTAELSIDDLQALSSELSAAYILTGTIHRFECSVEAAELSLAARLIYVPELTVEWAQSAAYYSGGPVSLLSTNIGGDTSRVIRSGARRLVDGFSLSPRHPRRAVSAVRGKHGSERKTYPCRTIALLPIANETATEFGGEMITDQLYAALYRRGFQITEVGRVREAMLSGNDLTRGESSLATVQRLREELAVDLVLTGTVSTLTSTEATRYGDPPAIALELRLVDTATGLVIWSRNYSRSGEAAGGLFGTGKVESAALMSRDLARDAVRSLKIDRARQAIEAQ